MNKFSEKDWKIFNSKKERDAAMISTEDIIPIVKNTITASIKCNTHRGYIGWSSCDNICMDMQDCLDMCAEILEMRGYMVVLEAATYILVSGVKLASHADSSSGMLTDVIMCTYQNFSFPINSSFFACAICFSLLFAVLYISYSILFQSSGSLQ